MIRVILFAITALIPPSGVTTLRVEGEFSGIKFLVTPGESTYTLGALPGVKERDGKVILDLGDVGSTIPPVLKKEIHLYIGKEFKNVEFDLGLEFSEGCLNLPELDTVNISIGSKFSTLEVKHAYSKVSFIDLYQIGGSISLCGQRCAEYGQFSLFVVEMMLSPADFCTSYKIDAGGSTIAVSEGGAVIHTEGLFNTLNCRKGKQAGGSQCVISVTGNLNKIVCE
ncbi:MAG: hypothetical protein WBI42_04470 [Candidatus Hydrothermia bacterium]|nr:hypothetical protein [Candidatus Hydrothermae bacterium]MDD3648767.1 hypothetical protein [Candidatus Hydrothermia bacterium]MDD5572902.1 hypothetical protein [Candidatus Hydrothermia bacterium]